jgi:hypothetical protein
MQTLIDIYHPMFRKGYQDGRKQYFQEKRVFTDKHLVELLQLGFEESEQEEEKDREEGVYYAIGRLMGQMSGCVIPQQPHEENPQEPQEAFLAKVMQEYGVEGKALIGTIRQFWTIQDQLAQTLEADIFEQMINRGVEKGYCL